MCIIPEKSLKNFLIYFKEPADLEKGNMKPDKAKTKMSLNNLIYAYSDRLDWIIIPSYLCPSSL